ncbi:MAG: DUF4136 domain-containing protein [Steroidobacteraceae bacterium]|jgi:hypothetical protein|nr:DUF4136 domain-containing protein [Steroidobacteraceae bacterium]
MSKPLRAANSAALPRPASSPPRVLAAVTAAIATLGLAACAGPARAPDVRTEAAPGVSVASRATFAWEESGVSWQSEGPPAVAAELRALVREAVVSELVKRGYAEGGDTPDFRVGFHVTIKDLPSKDLCTVRTHVFGAYTHRDVEVCRVHDAAGSREYRKGTLVVFVIDRETGVLLWQGVAEGTAGSPAEARSRVKAAIGRMFLDFPARGTEG